MWIISVVKFLNKLPKGLRVVIYVFLGLTVVFGCCFVSSNFGSCQEGRALDVAKVGFLDWLLCLDNFVCWDFFSCRICVAFRMVGQVSRFFTNWFNVVREFIGGKISGK